MSSSTKKSVQHLASQASMTLPSCTRDTRESETKNNEEESSQGGLDGAHMFSYYKGAFEWLDSNGIEQCQMCFGLAGGDNYSMDEDASPKKTKESLESAFNPFWGKCESETKEEQNELLMDKEAISPTMITKGTGSSESLE